MRKYKYDILTEIKDRWSARALSSKEISKDDVYALIEAASFAPSSMNEQPWRFIIGFEQSTLELLRESLLPMNKEWALSAPNLICILSKRTHTKNGKENKSNRFDAGSAFAFLSLEATKRGLIAHGMGGFDRDFIRTSFNISDDYDVVLMIAIGYLGDKSNLSEANQLRERPNERMDITELIINE